MVNHHIELLIEYRDGRPQREPVHAESIGQNAFRLQFSPGFVQGIATGDEFTLQGTDGAFHVTRRAGNLAIQLFSSSSIGPLMEELRALAVSLGGTVDGNIDRAAVLTVPVAAGFPRIEAALSELCNRHAGLEWYFGNVYDSLDGVTSLRWWEDGA
jgi:hypothetical protein